MIMLSLHFCARDSELILSRGKSWSLLLRKSWSFPGCLRHQIDMEGTKSGTDKHFGLNNRSSRCKPRLKNFLSFSGKGHCRQRRCCYELPTFDLGIITFLNLFSFFLLSYHFFRSSSLFSFFFSFSSSIDENFSEEGEGGLSPLPPHWIR